MANIEVNSKQGDTLIEYVGKTEYIPFLQYAFWKDQSEGFEIIAGMSKTPDHPIEKQYPNIEPERIGAFDCYIKRAELQDSDFSAVTLAFQQKEVTYLIQINYRSHTRQRGLRSARVRNGRRAEKLRVEI